MIDRDDLHDLVNAHRVDKGREKLVLNQHLNKSAMAKCKHMAKHKYWDHIGNNGETPWQWFDRVGVSYAKAGENLALGQRTSYDAFNGWRNSKSHNKNMLDMDFTHVGYATCNVSGVGLDEHSIITVQHLADVI